MIYKLFARHSKNDHANSIAAYLPNDITFEAKNESDTNLRKLLLGFSVELKKIEDILNLLVNEFGPENTEYLISKWEKMVGIPYDIFFLNTADIDTRKNQVLIKLAKMNSQTTTEFELVSFLLGIPITVLSGYDAINPPYSYSIPQIANDTQARFSIVCLFQTGTLTLPVFPLTFPISFGQSEFLRVEGILNKLKPANCQLILMEE